MPLSSRRIISLRSPRQGFSWVWVLGFLGMALPASARFELYPNSPLYDLGLSTPAASVSPLEEPFRGFQPEDWSRARELREKGQWPVEPPEGEGVVSSPPAPAPPPPEEPGFNVDLPYESGLSISGRKLIKLSLEEKRRKSAKRAQELGLPQVEHTFDMKQELQVRIKGKVGRKVTVNVDFDDTRDDKRDISVVYQGDPEEIVQEAAFGDITLSLPSTEFVSYSKQLFGVRTRLRYRGIEWSAIGSRTKGISETKRFNGNTRSDRRDIQDISYISQRYYQLPTQGKNILSGSEQVWVDDQDGNNNGNAQSLTALRVDGSTATGVFDRKIPGLTQNFTIDYVRGILKFNAPLQNNWVVVASFTYVDNTVQNLTVIKDTNDRFTPQSREIKTYYSIGQTKIVPDDGRGNFILKVADLNRNDTNILLENGRILRYPDTMEVDYEAGIFNIKPTSSTTGLSFIKVDSTTTYAESPTHTFSFLLEYKYRLKNFTLKPNMVLGSERVSLNGRVLARDIDYFIDYDSGYLSFFTEDQLDENALIEVNYEYASFGNVLGQTLVGSRLEYRPFFNPALSSTTVQNPTMLGSTILYTFAPKPTIVPDMRATPNSLMVMEADGKINQWMVPRTSFTVSLAGEVARSVENPNLFGRALVDSMEGLEQEDATAMLKDSWQVSANPALGPVMRPSGLDWSESEEGLRSINPYSRATSDEKQRVLNLSFQPALQPESLFNGERQSSLVQVISKSGRDFTKKTSLEVWIKGLGPSASAAQVDLMIDAGNFSEDADGDGVLDTEDKINPDGQLNPGEDVGWTFNDPGEDQVRDGVDDSTVTLGANNGRLDTEDLNGDRQLFIGETPVRAGKPLFRLSDLCNVGGSLKQMGAKVVDPSNPDNVNVCPDSLSFSGWRFFSIPLNIAPTEIPNFQSVRAVRLTLVNKEASPSVTPVLFSMGKVAFSGSSWESAGASPGSTGTVTAVNNLDNPDYVDLIGQPGFNDIYGDAGDDRTREQALSLRFTLAPGDVTASTASTRQSYFTPRDFSKHRSLSLFLRTPQANPAYSFIFQMGSETSYFEIEWPLSERYHNAWIQETLTLDPRAALAKDAVKALNPLATVRVIGSPSLTSVGQLRLVAVNRSPGTVQGELWVNEIFVSGVVKKEGLAHRVTADLSLPGWLTLGGKAKGVDRDFQTLTSPVVNQDRNEASGYATFNRIKYLTLSGNWAKNWTVTPSVLRAGEASLISVLSEGREETVTGNSAAQLAIPLWPALNVTYDKATSRSDDRQEERDRQTYTGTLDYQLPFNVDLFPGKRSFKIFPQNITARYSRGLADLSFFDEKVRVDLSTPNAAVRRTFIFDDAFQRELRDEWSARAVFLPWVGLSLTPEYSLGRTTQRRDFTENVPEFEPARNYNKSLTNKQALTMSWRLLSWLEPRASYDRSGTETNLLPSVSSPTAANVKTLDRSGTGNLSLNLAGRALFSRLAPIQSLTLDNSFQAEVGDTYDNLAKDDRSWQKIDFARVRKVPRKNGRSMYGILDPLSAENGGVVRRRLTARNTFRSTNRWAPLDWVPFGPGWSPLKTLDLTGTFTNTEEHNESTDTTSDITTQVWPDLLVSLRDTEKLFHVSRWMKGWLWNGRTNRRRSLVFAEKTSRDDSFNIDTRFVMLRRYEFYMTHGRTRRSEQDLKLNLTTTQGKGLTESAQISFNWGLWRVTPSVNHRQDQAKNSSGQKTSQADVLSAAIAGRLDRNLPGGFRMPFTRKLYGNVNRLTIDTKLSGERKKDLVESNNTDSISADTTGEWQIAQNFRLSFGGGISWVRNRIQKSDQTITISLNSQLVIQF